jgi:hypothetical protein
MKSEKRVLYMGAVAIFAIGLLIAGVSPLYLLLLACPLSMMFMMHGMGHNSTNHREHSAEDSDRKR